MRTLTKILLMVGLALTISTSAGAVITIGLNQVGGTYNALTGAVAGDTLILDITWSVGTGDTLALIDPGLVFNGAVSTFVGDQWAPPYPSPGSSESYTATFGPALLKNKMTNIARYDIGVNVAYSNMANGWEKAAPPGGFVTGPCTTGSCASMGTGVFILSGAGGIIAVGGVGMGGGTVVADGTFIDIAGNTALVSLGSFTIIPEPTTASLLGLGLLGLTVAGRSRKS
jgi:hypothetical protein